MNTLFDFSPLGEEFDLIVGAFWDALSLAILTGIFAMILGTILAAMRVSPVPVLRLAGTFYVNTMRNTPLTLIMLFCYFGLADQLGILQDHYFWLALFGLGTYTSAFICEVLRSGINTVPLGQAEAARAIGLPFSQSLRLVILPQAFRSVIAPLGSVIVAMMKNTTVALAAGYIETAATMKNVFEEHGATPAIFIGFAGGWLLLTLPTGYFFTWLSKRMAVAR